MKIKIKSILKSKKENHTFEGKGIKNKNVIMYKDNNIITKITIDDTLYLERIEDYNLKLNLKEGIKQKGKYITKYGNLKLDTFTHNLNIEKNKIKTKYDLYINDEYIDTFDYILEYSIDRVN